MKMIKPLLILITIFICRKSFGQLQFEEIAIDNVSTIINTISGSKKVIFINSSNSGMLDLLVNSSNDETLFFRNNMNNDFTSDSNFTLESRITDILDFDFDGDMDIASYKDGEFEMVVYLNDGAGIFTTNISIPSTCDFNCVSSRSSFADITNDLKMDFVSNNYIPFIDFQFTEEQLLINNGDNTFTNSNDLITSFHAGNIGIEFVDFDNDGDFDIYTNGETIGGITGTEYTSSFFVNNGNAVFPTMVNSSLPQFYKVTFADFNGDGIKDAYSNKSVYLNDGSGEFSVTFSLTDVDTDSSNRLAYIGFGDINDDEATDIVLSKGTLTDNTWTNTTSELYLNDGNGGFSLISVLPFQNFRIASSDVADIDSNGSKEIIIHARNESNNVVTKLYSITESLNINEFQLGAELIISPNPTVESFKINGIEHVNVKAINIFNISGQLIREFKERNTLERNNFNISTLSKGIYIIEIRSEKYTYYKKLIRQ